MYNYDTLTQLIDVMNRLTMLIYWGNGAELNQNYPQGRADPTPKRILSVI